MTEKIGKGLVLEVISSFPVLCGVGFVAGIIGPERIRPVVNRVGGKAAFAGVLLIFGSVLIVLYYGFTS